MANEATQHHTLRTINGYDKDGNPVTKYMYEAQFATKGKFSFQRHYQCAICLQTFPKSEIRMVRGVPYCTRYRHYQDAP